MVFICFLVYIIYCKLELYMIYGRFIIMLSGICRYFFTAVMSFIFWLPATAALQADSTIAVKSTGKMVNIGGFFPIEPASAYQATLALRGEDGVAGVGIRFYDQKNRLIWPHTVNPVAGTETVLTLPAKCNSNFIVVKDAGKWLKSGAGIVVFNARKDFSDLPNFEVAYTIKKISKVAEGFRIDFSGKVNKDYAAGTMVRQHRGGSWMNFAYTKFKVAADAPETIVRLHAADPLQSISNRVWQGAIKGQFFIVTAKPLTVETLALKKIAADAQLDSPVTRLLQGRKLAAAAKVFGGKSIHTGDAIAVQTVNGKSGFYNNSCAWPAGKVRQLEFTIAADQAGYVRFVNLRNNNGAKKVISTAPHSVIPDGKYHTLIFDFSNDPRWVGDGSNWELRWFGNPGKLTLKKIVARQLGNRIPDLSDIPLNTPVRTALLEPLKIYRLEWVGGGNANGTLKFFDRNMQEIPHSSKTLSAELKQVDIKIPEMTVYAEFTASAPGNGGRARLYMLPEAKRSWRGSWIWSHDGSGPENHSVWFEKTIDLESVPEYAAYAVSADDVSYLYVNGRFAGASNNWMTPQRYDITRFLKKGSNRLVFRVHNYTQNAGLLADFYIKLNSREIFLQTDSSWHCESKSNLHNSIPQKIDQKVHVFGPVGIQPWGFNCHYRYVGTLGMLEAVDIAPGKITAIVKSLPKYHNSNLRFELRNNGKLMHDLQLAVTPGVDTWKLNEKITIEYKVPQLVTGEAELYLVDDYVFIKGSPCLAKLKAVPRKSDFLPAKFVPGALMQVQLGNRIFPSYFWNASSLSRDPAQVIAAHQRGFKNYRIYMDIMDFYQAPGKFDFTKVNEQITRLLSIDKNAVFYIQLRVHMPEWWLMQNPDHVSKHYGNNRRRADRDRQGLASAKWVADLEDPIKALLEHLKNTPFADRIWGIGISENGNGEWFWGNLSADNKRSWAGYSKGEHEAFRAFLKKRYASDAALAQAWKQPQLTLATAMMAPPQAIQTASIGELMDPQTDRQAMDTAEFRSWVLGEALINICKYVKKYSDNKLLTGAYFGYHTELAENSGRPIQLSGHNAFLEVARSPYVDCVYAPSRYTYRKTGLADNIMQPWSSYLLRNKVVYVEQDMRTALGPQEHFTMKIYVGQPSSTLESIGHINRAFGMSLATGCTMYVYDIANGSFHDKVFGDCLREQLEVLSELPKPQGLIPLEMAVVSSRKSIYYSRTAHENSIYTGAWSGLYFAINHLAAPYRSLVVEDLLDKDLEVPAHKFYIMLPTLVLSKEERSGLMQRFEREKATVVWLYTAGASYPDNAAAAASCGDFLKMQFDLSMQRHQIKFQTVPAYGNITGRSWNSVAPLFYPTGGFDSVIAGENGKPVVVKKSLNGATHIFSTSTDLPAVLYKKLLKEAGVHCYTDSLCDPVWAGNDVVFLHAAAGGEKSFNIPANCQLRGIIGPYKGTLKNGEKFSAEAAMTYGFIMEKQ